jgi:hypothetical protein
MDGSSGDIENKRPPPPPKGRIMRVLCRSRHGIWLLAGSTWLAACAVFWWAMPVVTTVFPIQNEGKLALRFAADCRSASMHLFREEPDSEWTAADLIFLDFVTGSRSQPLAPLLIRANQVSDDLRWVAVEALSKDKSSRTLRVLDRSSGELRVIPETEQIVKQPRPSFSFYRNGTMLVIREWTGDIETERAWNLNDLRPLSYPDGWHRILCESDDGKLTVLSRSAKDGSPNQFDYLFWDFDQEKAEATIRNAPSLSSVSISLSGLSLIGYESVELSLLRGWGDVVCLGAGGRKVWEVKNATLFPVVANGSEVPIDRIEPTTSDRYLEFRNSDHGSLIRRLPLAPFDRVLSIAPDGKTIAVERASDANAGVIADLLRRIGWLQKSPSGPSTQIVLIDSTTGQQLMKSEVRGWGRFSQDSQQFIVHDSSSDRVYLWDIPPRKSLPWFGAGAALLGIPILYLARRRIQRLRAA